MGAIVLLEHKNKTPEGAFILTIFDNSGIMLIGH